LPDFPFLENKYKIIVSDYINSAFHSKPEIFEYIETVVKGYMLVNALYLPDANQTSRKFQRTKIFLDTSFIIFALGYSGDEMKAPCLELLNLLYISGAQLYCLPIQLKRLKGILNACSSRLGRPDESTLVEVSNISHHMDAQLLMSNYSFQL